MIDYLAHKRFNGDARSTAAVLASHPHGTCPTQVKEQVWHRFLGDLLRPTGLLAQRSDFAFLTRLCWSITPRGTPPAIRRPPFARSG
jgi:hypothetical protein